MKANRKTDAADPAALAEFMQVCRARTEHALDRWLPADDLMPQELHAAMRYAALAGGKYVRPLLVYATGRAFGVGADQLDAPACAVELIHAYSLVHDDLPAMDNDALRRGKPSCHVAYGEATAILAGDALQALAFHVLASDGALRASPARRLRMIDTLAVASSSLGMAGGQATDLAAVGRTLDIAELESMHTRKTGALIRASVLLGALCQETLDGDSLHRLASYARCIGLAFQIRDDILDVEGDTQTLGKTQGGDRDKDKPTYASLLGLEGAKRRAVELHEEALDHLDALDAGPGIAYEGAAGTGLLRALADYIVRRAR